MMNDFKRPAGFGNGHRDDPEEQYRAGYQHGARAVLDALRSGNVPSDLEMWVDVKLANWRHNREADPNPPKL